MRKTIFILYIFLLLSLATSSYAGWTEPVFVDSHRYISPPWNAIEARNDSIYIIYNYHNIIRSTDGGLSWQDRFVLPDDRAAFQDVGFKLTNDTLAAFYYSWQGIVLLFSTDFGESWEEPRVPDWDPSDDTHYSANYNSTRVSVCMIDDIDPYNVHIFLKNSTDFGVTWEDVDSIWTYHRPLQPFLYFFYGEPYILATSSYWGSYSSTIKLLFSIDDGEEWIFHDSLSAVGMNWEQRMDASAGGQMAITYHEWFPQHLSTSQVYVCLSSDSGMTWAPPIDLSFQEHNKYPSVGVSGDTVVVAWHGSLYPDSIGGGILVRRSYDFGQTWEPLEIAAGFNAAYPEIKIEGGKIHLIYVGDDEGLYYRRWEPETSIEEETIKPVHISFLRAFPNPFNSSTTISYGLSEVSNVCIEIYNILGQHVETVFEGEKPTGNHVITWDASAFPSGVYFARLKTPKGLQSAKMVLLK